MHGKYKMNPYYTSVGDLQKQGINDEILNNTGYWKNTTSIYGPLWNIITEFLVKLSFGSITLALFIFKIVSFLIHILNSHFIYKLTKSNKYMLLYALNPLVLVELLSNVHNDIYLIFFTLLAIYFLIRKKNIYLTILFLALSVSIKYSTALLVPFILIYCFKDKKIPKRILLCILSGYVIVAIVALFYLRYYKDYTVFTNMLVQGNKYSQSILAFLKKKSNTNIFKIVKTMAIPVFIGIYILSVVRVLFKKKISLELLMRRYNFVMLIFIFIVLTSFQKWYVLWLLPTLIWQSKKMRNFILCLTITAIIPSIRYFLVQGDPFMVGISYSIKMLVLSGIGVLVFSNISKIKEVVNNVKSNKSLKKA